MGCSSRTRLPMQLTVVLLVCLAVFAQARPKEKEETLRRTRDPEEKRDLKERKAPKDADCLDITPPWSFHSCASQAEFGTCGEDWMKGYCLKSCQKCKDTREECIVHGSLFHALGAGGEVSEQDDPVVVKCPKSCNNKPPPFSTNTCETHKTLGKCKQSWMNGSCECTCGTCQDLLTILEEERKTSGKEKRKGEKKKEKDASEEPAEKSKEKSHRRAIIGDTVSMDCLPLGSSKTTRKLKQGHHRFTILHFNDFHSRVEPADNYFGECTPDESDAGRCHGGVARMKTLIDRERRAAAERGESVLLLNPGDDFAGTKWDFHYQGKAVAHFLNKLGIDAMTLGNHEFDYGPDVLANYVKSLNYSVLCSNMKGNGHWLESLVQPYIIKEVDGVKVGICGTTTQVTMQWSKPWPVQLDDSTYKARECVKGLQSQGIKIIILLSHEGLNADRYLGRQVEGIDLIIGGHSHSFLFSGDSPPAISHFSEGSVRDVSWDSYPAVIDSWIEPDRKVYILQAGWASRYLGRISVEFDEEGELVDYEGSPILMGGDASDNPVKENLSWKEDVASYPSTTP